MRPVADSNTTDPGGSTWWRTAVTSTTQVSAIPDVPTLAEVGLKGFDFVIWHGLYVPKGMPDAIVEILNRALNASLDDRRCQLHHALRRPNAPPAKFQCVNRPPSNVSQGIPSKVYCRVGVAGPRSTSDSVQ